MHVIKGAEIVAKTRNRGFYQVHFLELDELKPDMVVSHETHVLFRLAKVRYDIDVPDGVKAKLVGTADTCGCWQLRVTGDDRLILPTDLWFKPEIYIPNGRGLSRRHLSKKMLTSQDLRAMQWMDQHEFDEAIQASDGSCHQASPNLILVGDAVPA